MPTSIQSSTPSPMRMRRLGSLVAMSMALLSPACIHATTDAEEKLEANPYHFYCAHVLAVREGAGDCGTPCPSGYNSDCTYQERCYGPQLYCEAHRMPCPFGAGGCGAGATSAWSSAGGGGGGGPPPPGMHWCARSHKHLLESCPKQCRGGSDDECGSGMQCFNMQYEDTPCTKEGVGVKEKSTSNTHWCGSSWLHVQENCAKACPDGTNEECSNDAYGNPMKCYDMASNANGNTKVCQMAGHGVKLRGDPNKRFCGASEMDMLATCPKRCYDGVCPSGMRCFEKTPCIWEGVGVEGALNKRAQEIQEEKDQGTTTQLSVPGASAMMMAPIPAPAPQATTQTNQNVQVVQSQNVNVPIEPVVQSTGTGLLARNLRMAVYGLDALSSNHLAQWERHTANFVGKLYNDLSETYGIQNNAVNIDITEVNLSSDGRRQLRGHNQEFLDPTYILTYTQITRHLAQINLGRVDRVLETPFSDPTKRDNFVRYLRQVDPTLFGKLSSVSTVLLPEDLEASVVIFTDEDELSYDEGTSKSTKYNSFYCLKSGMPCPTGECSLFYDQCMFVSDGRGSTPLAPYPGNQPMEIEDHALVDIWKKPTEGKPNTESVHEELESQSTSPPTTTKPSRSPSKRPSSMPSRQPSTKPSPRPQASVSRPVQPTPSSTSVVPMSYNEASNTVHAFGPVIVNGLELSLDGILLNKAEHLYEWQYLTAAYIQNFYNDSPFHDYIKNQISEAIVSIEVTNVSFKVSPSPTTTITFTQTSKYNSKDIDILVSAVLSQPFLISPYRDIYIRHLKHRLRNPFGDLRSVSAITMSQTLSQSFKLRDTFVCGNEWPVLCSNTQRCENDKDCPTGQGCFTTLPSCTTVVERQPDQQEHLASNSHILDVPQPAPSPKDGPSSDQPNNHGASHQAGHTTNQGDVDAQQSNTTTSQAAVSEGIVSEQGSTVSTCNLCKAGLSARDLIVNINDGEINCLEAHKTIETHFQEGSESCTFARSNLSESCCFQIQEGVSTTQPTKTSNEVVSIPNPAGRQPAFSEDPSTSNIHDEVASNITGTQSQDAYKLEEEESISGDRDWWLSQWESHVSSSSYIGSYTYLVITISFATTVVATIII